MPGTEPEAAARAADPPLRLVAVAPYPPQEGGAARSNALLLRGLAARGHRVHVHASITPPEAGHDTRSVTDPPSLSVSRYVVPHFNLEPFDVGEYLTFQAMELGRIRDTLPAQIERRAPDLLLCGHETLAAAAVDIADRHRLPLVQLLRGSPSWQIGAGVYPQRLAAAYLDHFRRADALVAVGRYLCEGLDRLGIGAVSHLPNFVDLDRFRPGPAPPGLRRRYGIGTEATVVLHASLMQSRKRPADVLEAAFLSLPTAPDLFFLFVGGGERAVELEAAAARSPVADRIRFEPRVPYDEMPDHLRMADMVVLASEGEGIPRIGLEAQACGRTFISSDIPAGREIVSDGRDGLLYPTGSPASLSAAILTAAGDPALRRRLGRAARRRVAPHAIDRVLDGYEALLRSCAGRVDSVKRAAPRPSR
ncbi:MAG: glycosyltransferase family 4 protein [Thermoanaerobaculia bacterium]|nr:glycosyltransferase family 4 protein [Thermoanaerobaculia bacterium]